MRWDKYFKNVLCVAPLNTGRLVACDAEQIIQGVAIGGLDVPRGIRNTSRNVFNLVEQMNKCLVQVEEYYENQRLREMTKSGVYAMACSSVMFYLAANSATLRNRGILLGVLTICSTVLPRKDTKTVENTRRNVQNLLQLMTKLREEGDENVGDIRNLVKQAIKQQEQIGHARNVENLPDLSTVSLNHPRRKDRKGIPIA